MTLASQTDGPEGASLMCGMGWHAPGPLPIWNNGYYFSVCRRCERDIVRPFHGRWQLPRGYRVVWQRDRPAGEGVPVLAAAAVTADVAADEIAVGEPLAPEEAVDDTVAVEAASAPEDLVDRDADVPVEDTPPPPDEFAEVGFPTSGEEPALRPPEPRASAIPDFMNDTSFFSPDPYRSLAHGVSDPLLLSRGAMEQNRDEITSFASKFSPLRRFAATSGSEASSGRLMTIGLVAAVVFLLALLINDRLQRRDGALATASQPGAYSIPGTLAEQSSPVESQRESVQGAADAGTAQDGDDAGKRGRGLPSRPTTAQAITTGPDQARSNPDANQIVGASVLNCRKVPTPGASVSMKLLRGAAVSSSDRRGEWTYITRHGHSCWAKSELLER